MNGIWIKAAVLLTTFLLLEACLPHSKSSVHPLAASLILQGRVTTSAGQAARQVPIYVEQFANPEALTADDGSFSISWDADRLADLRLRHGLQNKNLHLYFIKNNGGDESSLVSTINLLDRGTVDLGLIRLSPNTSIKGRVLAKSNFDDSFSPAAQALVRIGRQLVLTDAKGEFISSAPKSITLPMLIEKNGFVQSQANWIPETSEVIREFKLFTELRPMGQIELLTSDRSLLDAPSAYSYSATSVARWIRLSSDETNLRDSRPNAAAPWQTLNENLKLNIDRNSSKVGYYQFANDELTIFSNVQSINF